MLGLEEQARMNYLAYAAAGPNHASIPDALIQEGIDRPPLYTMPHFVDSMRGRCPDVKGVWQYYADRVTHWLDRELTGARS